MKFNNRNVLVSPKARIGKGVRIGDNTTIYDNVTIGDNSVICNDCVIGEPPWSYYADPDSFHNPPTLIGANSMVRSHSIIYAGSEFGDYLVTGHRLTVREGAKVGSHCLLSTLVDIQGNCKIGDYSRVYSNVHISEKTSIGKYVFIYPYTIFTNDPQPPSTTLLGASVGDYSIITIHCCVLPGVRIGKHCLIGANSVISRDMMTIRSHWVPLQRNNMIYGTFLPRPIPVRNIIPGLIIFRGVCPGNKKGMMNGCSLSNQEKH